MLLMLLLMVVMVTTVCYAQTGNSDIFQMAADIAQNVQVKILGISSALCGVGLVIAAIIWGFGNKQQTQMGWEWMKRIVIAYIVINSIPLIITPRSEASRTSPDVPLAPRSPGGQFRLTKMKFSNKKGGEPY